MASRFSSPPISSPPTASTSSMHPHSPASPTRHRSRTTTGGAGTAAGGGGGLKVSTSDLGVPPSFLRSKSSSSAIGLSLAGVDSALSRVSSNTSEGGGLGSSLGLNAGGGGSKGKRGRSSSILSIHEIKENYDDDLDQAAMANLNADWVNYKGAWLIHIVLILIGKVLVDSIPGMEQDTSWTIVLQGYLLATYLMFHFVEGVPFESNSGVYDRLTMWEQIDGGAQYTPAKKWLTSLPIMLFLLSTHYTRYDHHPALFSLNLVSLVLLALIPKLPQVHRQRVTFGPPKHVPASENISTGANTPVETAMGRASLPSVME